MPPVIPPRIYHLVTATYLESVASDAEYFPHYFDEEGFIHATMEPEWVEKVANRIFANMDGEVKLLEVDTAKVQAEIRLEESKGHWYPHIYGGLNWDAILRTATLPRDADGHYHFPTEWNGVHIVT
jgi:uncharacterized protein (DUF952 family)